MRLVLPRHEPHGLRRVKQAFHTYCHFPALFYSARMKLQLQPADTAASHPLFDANPGLWAGIAGVVRKKPFYNGERVMSHGDGASCLWLVYRGWVKLTRQTPDGKETVIGLCTEGDIFGEAALFANANYPYTADIVGSDAELASIPATTMSRLVAQNTSLSASVMALLNERTAQTQLKLEHMSTMTAAQRLGCFLLRLCHAQVDGAKMLRIPVEKHILAAYLGMKPETLSRSQQQLKPLGIEISGHDIAIGNIGKLRNFVCNSCSESGNCDVEASS